MSHTLEDALRLLSEKHKPEITTDSGVVEANDLSVYISVLDLKDEDIPILVEGFGAIEFKIWSSYDEDRVTLALILDDGMREDEQTVELDEEEECCVKSASLKDGITREFC